MCVCVCVCVCVSRGHRHQDIPTLLCAPYSLLLPYLCSMQLCTTQRESLNNMPLKLEKNKLFENLYFVTLKKKLYLS